MTGHAQKKARVGGPCACGCGHVVPQSPGAGRPRAWIEGHRPKKPLATERICACGCGLVAVRLHKFGPPPKYFPGHSPSDRKNPWRAKKR